MLMLYVFKVEVFDLSLSYAYSTDYTIVAGTNEDRSLLVRSRFELDKQSVVKHSLLVGARFLTCSEVALLKAASSHDNPVWLVTRVRSARLSPGVRCLPRLTSEAEMLRLTKAKSEAYDGVLFLKGHQMSARNSHAANMAFAGEAQAA